MTSPFSGLIADIERERKHLHNLVQEMNDLQSEVSSNPDSRTTRAAGSILHDFYTGIEKIFRRIALEMEGDLPDGDEWHRQLLERMGMKIKDVRPALISDKLEETLDEYLRFRHVFRHSYGYELEWEKCENLIDELPETHENFENHTKEFIEFLDELDDELES